MLDFLFRAKTEEPRPDPEWLVEMRERQYRAAVHRCHIRDALRAKGFDPDMLDDIGDAYAAAALILGVKE